MNIIFGIIIDTFKVLRNKNNEIFQEKNNLCYICFLTQTEFDKEQQDFEMHIKKDHNIWNYIYFIFYIYNKFSTEYSGIESKVKRKLDTKDINWIPFMATEKIKGEKKVSIDQQINILKEKTKVIKDYYLNK